MSLDKYIYTINVNTFRVDTGSSVHIDNKKKDVLILSKGPIEVLDKYYVNSRSSLFNWFFQYQIENFIEACIIKKATAFYFLMLQKYINSKQKVLK